MSSSLPTALQLAQLVQAEIGKLGYESRISTSSVVTMVFARDAEGHANGRVVTTLEPGVTAIAIARELVRGLGPPDPNLIKSVWTSHRPARAK